MKSFFRTIALLACLPAAAALAQATAGAVQETITLRNGDVYSGRLVERVPGDHLTLQLATGEVKVIPWSEIPATPAGPPPPNGTSDRVPPAATRPGVFVHLHTENPSVALYRLRSTFGGYDGDGNEFVGASYARVCLAPCNLRLDPARQYQIAGEGVAASNVFDVTSPTGRVDIDVKAGSAGRLALGQALTYGGAGLLLAGPISIAANGAFMPPALGSDMTVLWIGVGMTIVGAVALAIGIPLWVTSATKLTFDRTADSGGDDAPQPSGRPQPAYAF